MPEILNNKVSPIVAIAAVSVIIFSAVGVGVLTGVIPSSISKSGDESTPTATPQPVAAPAEQPKAVAASPRKHTTERAREPARVASAEPAPRVAEREPARTAQTCTNCGSVISVNLVKHEGEGSGLGAIGGAVVGGVLGHQVGSGRGRDVATVAGAGAGAYAGHQIEKNAKTTQSYVVAVRMNDGSTRNFTYQTEPGYQAGDKVRVVEGKLVSN